jgi:glutamate:GABA antiporter
MEKSKKLNFFTLAMINIALVMSLGGLPVMAKEGVSIIFYVLFSAVLFLFPVSLVVAELATGWPQEGGVYNWVNRAFGARWGFAAIWLQWVQTTILYPTILAFAAGALSYLFLDPTLASSKIYNMAVILIVYWGATFLNFRGLKTASWLTSICVLFGAIFPSILIIALGVYWTIMGNPLQFLQTSKSIIPDIAHFDSIALLAGTLLFFSGMEVSAVHIKNMKNPKKDYPKSIFLSMLVIICVFFFGSMAIAATIPESHISLTAGIMQGYRDLLHQFNLDALLPFIGFLIAFGAIGSLIAWIGGPSKGLLATKKSGTLPPFLQKTNKHQIPVNILWIQGVIVSVLSFVFLFMPNINSAFYLLTDLTIILYLVMYILLYASAIRLRYIQPNVKRDFKIPFGNIGMWIVAGMGIVAVLFAIVVGFFPPSELNIQNPFFYVLFISVGLVVFLSFPFIIYHFKKPSWKPKL